MGVPHLLRRRQFCWFVSRIRRGKGKGSERLTCRVLEVGCGSGWLSRLMCTHAFVVGVDRLPIAFPVVARGKPRVVFVQADGLRLPFPASTFDFIVLSSVLQMVSDDLQLLRECNRCLRRHGRLLMSVPSAYRFLPLLWRRPLHSLPSLLGLPVAWEEFQTVLATSFRAKGTGQYSASEITRMLSAAGFGISKCEYCPKALGTFLYEALLLLRVLRGARNLGGASAT